MCCVNLYQTKDILGEKSVDELNISCETVQSMDLRMDIVLLGGS